MRNKVVEIQPDDGVLWVVAGGYTIVTFT